MELSTSLTLLWQFFSLILSVASKKSYSTLCHSISYLHKLHQLVSTLQWCFRMSSLGEIFKPKIPRFFLHLFIIRWIHSSCVVHHFFKSPPRIHTDIFYIVGNVCISASIKTIKSCRLEQSVFLHKTISYQLMSCCFNKGF